MRKTAARLWLFWFGLGLFAACCLGCSKAGGGYDRYMPAEDTARHALTTALDAWKNGGRVGKIEGPPMQVNVVDSKWQAGQKLKAYEILGVDSSAGPARFSVRLTMQGSGSNKDVGYIVIGRSPNLWVYREEDYQHAAGL